MHAVQIMPRVTYFEQVSACAAVPSALKVISTFATRLVSSAPRRSGSAILAKLGPSEKRGKKMQGVFQLPKFTVVMWVRKTASYQAIHDELLELAAEGSIRIDRIPGHGGFSLGL
jgi:hypothetical protein